MFYFFAGSDRFSLCVCADSVYQLWCVRGLLSLLPLPAPSLACRRSCWFGTSAGAGTRWCSRSGSPARQHLARPGWAALPGPSPSPSRPVPSLSPVRSPCQPGAPRGCAGAELLSGAGPVGLLAVVCSSCSRSSHCNIPVLISSAGRWWLFTDRSGDFLCYRDRNKVLAEYFHLVCPLRNPFVRGES